MIFIASEIKFETILIAIRSAKYKITAYNRFMLQFNAITVPHLLQMCDEHEQRFDIWLNNNIDIDIDIDTDITINITKNESPANCLFVQQKTQIIWVDKKL